MSASIDLNCDLGEGLESDAAILPYITSASLACGGHAGDDTTMRRAVGLCLASGTAIGAHPSWPDREGFGRREMSLPASEVRALVSAQIRRLADIVSAAGGRLRHVKPHGALYNQAARDERLALVIAEAVHDFDPQLMLFGLADGRLLEAGRQRGLKVVPEVFADRTYQADGSLTPRSHPQALVESAEEAAVQVRRMLVSGVVRSLEGRDVPVQAGTVCLHGDHPQAARFARRLRKELEHAGIKVKEP